MFSKSDKNISELVSQLIEKYTRFRFPGVVAKKWSGENRYFLLWKIFVLMIGSELMAVESWMKCGIQQFLKKLEVFSSYYKHSSSSMFKLFQRSRHLKQQSEDP